jgi:subtilisin family serine protease
MTERPTTTRREFGKLTSVLAGLGLVGLTADVSAAADTAFDPAFANWRAREAAKVWTRGYRGRPDRTVALTDSGIDARHPDLGPWNGVRTVVRDGDVLIPESERERIDFDAGEQFSGTLGPGTFANPSRNTHEFTAVADAEGIDATMTWAPEDVQDNGEDIELYLDRRVDGEWERVAASTNGSQPEEILNYVEGGDEYRFVVETYLNVTCEYEITATYYAYEGSFEAADPSVVFQDVGSGSDDPKTVGWYDPGPRYGTYNQPRDPNGHGSHCASIMAGTGRASAVDPATVTVEEPGATLTLGETRQYEIDLDAGAGVFGAVYGTAVEIIIEDPNGRELDATSVTSDSAINEHAIAESPVTTSGTHTVIIRAAEGELASTAVVDAIAVGGLLDPASTNGDRTGDGAGTPNSLHSGVAPDQSLVGLQGLSGPTSQLAKHADDFSTLFNMRAVNMSWGYVGGLPLGSVGGILDTIPGGIKEIADAGVLTCAAAGNAATPANGNGSPAIAEECISVCATGPLDGLSAYSSGGIGALDEDDDAVYMKPDVSAPGGALDDLVDAAKTGAPDTPEDEQSPIADYTGKAGTSMATPYTTGVSGLVAQAMEEDAPAAIALPHPDDTTKADVFRLKQTLLATASETVFTAAGYHRAHAPTYDFGGRDPYEGYGRVNPDAAVDAVTRDLTNASVDATMGLNRPTDARAVAGYVQAGPGTVDVSVDFDYYSGGNKGMTKGDPHVDLFVYDAEAPSDYGEPNVLARAQGLDGSASATLSIPRDADERTLFVVAKLVNVPGVTNGYDVQAHCALDVAVETGFFVDGTREDDGSAFTGGQTNQIDLTVNPSTDSEFRDVVPTEWTVLTEYSDDIARVDETDGAKYVYFEPSATADTDTTVSYFVEAPEGGLTTNTYTFGPAEVKPDAETGWVAVSGTSDSNAVIGTST